MATKFVIANRPIPYKMENSLPPLNDSNSILTSLGIFIITAASIYGWVIIIRVLLTWINPNPYSPVMRLLARATDPVLNLGRRFFNLTFGGIDFSPLLVIIIIQLIGSVLGQWLIALGHGKPATLLLPILLLGLVSILDSILWMLIIIMAIRLIMSLVKPSPYNNIVQVIYGMTEPLLAPLRHLLPPGPGGLDLRPLLFLGVIILIQQMVLSRLVGLITAG